MKLNCLVYCFGEVIHKTPSQIRKKPFLDTPLRIIKNVPEKLLRHYISGPSGKTHKSATSMLLPSDKVCLHKFGRSDACKREYIHAHILRIDTQREIPRIRLFLAIFSFRLFGDLVLTRKKEGIMQKTKAYLQKHRGFTMMSLLISMVIMAIIGSGIVYAIAKNAEFQKATAGVQETEKISDVARKWYNRDANGDSVPDGTWPTVAQIQSSYYPGWNGQNPWGNTYNLTVSTEGILTITQTVPTKFVPMFTNRLSMSSAAGNVITYHVPPPGSYTENAGFVHRTGDVMDQGAELSFAGTGGTIEGLRNPDADGFAAGSDAVNVDWYDSDVEQRLAQLQGQIEDGSIVAGHAAFADETDYAHNADYATRAGYADNSGYASTAGYSDRSGLTNYASTAGSATSANYANTAGTAARATNADYATRADTARYADEAGKAPSNPAPTGTPPSGGNTWTLECTGGKIFKWTVKNTSSKTLSFRTTGSFTLTFSLSSGQSKSSQIGNTRTPSNYHTANINVICTTDNTSKSGSGQYATWTGDDH